MSENNPFDSILIRFGELCLKNQNRAHFEKKLLSNIQQQLENNRYRSIHRIQGGIVIRLSPESDVEQMTNRLKKVPGLSWFAPSWTTEKNVNDLKQTVSDLTTLSPENSRTFAVDSQRSDKSFELDSMELNTIVGGVLDEELPLNVDLDQPDWTLHIQVLDDEIHVFFERFEGLRGLPVGSTGRMGAMISGGIDSPVASILSLIRGSELDFFHFYAYPSPEDAFEAGMEELIKTIAGFGTRGTIHMIPYHPFELGLKGVPREYEMVLFRRHTMRVCQQLASKIDLRALVTGESLGQVASQTLENMDTIDQASDMLVLRPLSGMNKQEIVDRARQFGTYSLSIQDYKDCCSIQSNNPLTLTSPDDVQQIEENTNVELVDREAIENTESFPYDESGVNKTKSTTPVA